MQEKSNKANKDTQAGLFMQTLQAIADDNVQNFRDIYHLRFSAQGFTYPLSQFLSSICSFGSIKILREILSGNPYEPVDLKQESNVLFHLAWKRGHLDIMEEMIVVHKIYENNPELLNFLHSADIENEYTQQTREKVCMWIQLTQEKAALEKLIPLVNQSVCPEN